MTISVYSEIDPLREVLVHAPGKEVDAMPPALMKELLFDDIIYGKKARREHARFCSILRALGALTHDIAALFKDAVLAAEEEPVAALIDSVTQIERLSPGTDRILRDCSRERLAEVLIEGVRAPGDDFDPDHLFLLSPAPNLLFSRDAQVALADGFAISAMSRHARRREPLISRFVFSEHPRYRHSPMYADFLRPRSETGKISLSPTLEGGDVLIFREGVVVVGVSERTTEQAVDQLASALRPVDAFHTLIMVPMPMTRSAMHLDTIFTRTSEDECLVYSPLILEGGTQTLSVIQIDLNADEDWGRRRPSLLDALRRSGVDLRPISCGGSKDYVQQTREQWTDGANSFAAAPGVIILYARNEATAEELGRNGYEIITPEDIEFGEDEDCKLSISSGKKYAILLAGEELSRARGGPRCMTMPLARSRD
ncbi:MAG: arginine deiminase family protein [Planctomycetota bacterium]